MKMNKNSREPVSTGFPSLCWHCLCVCVHTTTVMCSERKTNVDCLSALNFSIRTSWHCWLKLVHFPALILWETLCARDAILETDSIAIKFCHIFQWRKRLGVFLSQVHQGFQFSIRPICFCIFNLSLHVEIAKCFTFLSPTCEHKA